QVKEQQPRRSASVHGTSPPPPLASSLLSPVAFFLCLAVLAKNGREHVRINSSRSFVAHLVTSMVLGSRTTTGNPLIRIATERDSARYVSPGTISAFSHSTMSCGASRAVSIQRPQRFLPARSNRGSSKSR